MEQITGNHELAKFISARTQGRGKLKELCRKIDLSQSYLSLVRTGKRGISVGVARKIAKVLGEEEQVLIGLAIKEPDRTPYVYVTKPRFTATFSPIVVPVKYAAEVTAFLEELERKIEKDRLGDD